MPKIAILFESCGNYITARDSGSVLIRCSVKQTDCGENEPLDGFIVRHGGTAATVEYLRECYNPKEPAK